MENQIIPPPLQVVHTEGVLFPETLTLAPSKEMAAEQLGVAKVNHRQDLRVFIDANGLNICVSSSRSSAIALLRDISPRSAPIFHRHVSEHANLKVWAEA